MFYRYADDYQEMYRKAVTAYTSNIPIIVNGYDINQSSYPAINYRPFSDRPYYSYVPVASFDKVGATVVYDSQANVINITTDYYLNKDTITQQQNRIKELEEQIKLCPTNFVRYLGIVDGYYKFGYSYWRGNTNYENGFTIGNCYKTISNEYNMGTDYMYLLNDNNESSSFSASTRNHPRGIIYNGNAGNGLYSFTWEGGTGISKFKIIKPSDGNISLEPGRVYVVTKNDTDLYSEFNENEYKIVGTDIVISLAS